MGGVPLLLLPGMLCDAELWEQQIRHLAPVAEAVVGSLTQDDSVAGMAERMLRTAPRHFALAGLSLGGIVALEMVRRAPERVSTLMLLSTTPDPARPDQAAFWEETVQAVERGHFGRVIREQWVPDLLAASAGIRPGLADTIRQMAVRVGAEAYVCQLRAQIGRPDSRPSLGAIHCPTLLIAGRQDTICSPALHRSMGSTIPRARVEILENCGHLSTLEQPERVTALLCSWLRTGSRDLTLADTTSLGGSFAREPAPPALE